MADNFGLKIGIDGEKAFKSALADINKSFKVLGSEMKLVDSQFDKNEQSVEALTARNKVLDKEIENQKEKINTLKAALKNASDSFGEADNRTKNWQIKLNEAEATLNKLESQVKSNNKAIENAGDEFNSAKNKVDKFGDEIESSSKQASSAKDKFEKLGSVLKGVGTAMATSVAAIGTAAVATGKKLYDMAGDTAEYGDTIDKTSQKLGMSAEAYQEWEYVMSQNGMDITSMTTGMKTLTNQIDAATNGSESAQEMFSKLGISMEEISSMSRDDVFALVVERMQSMGDTTERAALATDLFGKSGVNLAPLLNQSAEATENLKNKAHEYGFVMSDEAVQASVNFQDTLDTLQRTFTGVKNGLVSELLPGITTVMQGLTDMMVGESGAKETVQKGVGQIVDSLKEILPGVINILFTLVTSIAEIAPSIIDSLITGLVDNMDAIIEGITTIFESLMTAILENAPELAEGALTLLMNLIDVVLENLPLLIETMITVATTLLNGIVEQLPVLIPQLIESFITIIQTCLPQLILGINQLIVGIVEALPTIILAIVEALPTIIDSLIQALLQCLPALIQGGIDMILALVEALPDIIMALVEAMPQIITSIIEGLTEALPQLIEGAITLVVELVKHMPEIIEALIKAAPMIIKSLVEGLVSCVGMLIEVGGQLIEGLWNGIKDAGAWLWDKISGFFGGIVDKIKNFFGIASPSKLFKKEIGKNLALGVGEGFEDTMGKISDDMVKAVPTDFDTQINAAYRSASNFELAGAGAGAGGFVTNITFGDVHVTDQSDIDKIKNVVIEAITDSVRFKR